MRHIASASVACAAHVPGPQLDQADLAWHALFYPSFVSPLDVADHVSPLYPLL
jgi:hypothetical protein